jgi:hypothetical protein
MGNIIIEYRYRASDGKRGRRDTSGMRYYLEGLVDEMRSAEIKAEYIDSVALDGEPNSVTVNGKDVRDILSGLEIKMLEMDDCERPGLVTFGRPVTDWNNDVIEDIPDVLMKNAVSKAYADMNKNG